MPQSIQEIGIDTRTIYDRLIAAEIGETIPYADLTKLIGRSVQSHARGPLGSARRMAMRDEHIVFGTVIGVGLKRLADPEIVQTADAFNTKIRRTARRGIKTITSIADFDALTSEMKVKHNTFASMFGAIAAMSKPASVKRLEQAVNTAQTGVLPIGRVLETFTK